MTEKEVYDPIRNDYDKALIEIDTENFYNQLKNIFYRSLRFLFIFGIIGLILLINSRAEVNITQAHNITFESSQTGTYPDGFRVNISSWTTSITGIEVTRYPSDTAVNCYAWQNCANATSTNFNASGNFTGEVCRMNYNFLNGTNYCIGIGNGFGGSYTEYFHNGVALPKNDSNLIWDSCALYNNPLQKFDLFTQYACDIKSLVIITNPAVANPTLNLNPAKFLTNNSYWNRNFNLSLNGTFINTVSNNLVNCTFYINNTLRLTALDRNITIQDDIGNIMSYLLNESIQNLTAICQNYEVSANFTIQNVTYDAIPPRIDSSFVNHSNFNQLEDILIYINFTDMRIYNYSIILKDINSAIIETYSANGLNTGFAFNSTTRIATNLGNYSIWINATDFLNNSASEILYYMVSSASSTIDLTITNQLLNQSINETKQLNEAVSMLGGFIFWAILFLSGLGILVFAPGIFRALGTLFLGIFFALFPMVVTTTNFIPDPGYLVEFQIAMNILFILNVLVACVIVLYESLVGMGMIDRQGDKKDKPKDRYDIY